jgi:hypothetical protein
MMAKRNGIPKTDPSEIEALIRRLKQSNIGALKEFTPLRLNSPTVSGEPKAHNAFAGLFNLMKNIALIC